MRCRTCHGLIWDFQDDLGPRCISCGRSPDPPPSATQLRAAGIIQDVGLTHRQEMVGRKGPKNAREYSPAALALTRPLSPWQR